MSLFGVATHENLPPIFAQSHKAWDAYMAHLWYNFLCYFKLNKNATVVEVGPGNSVKIGVALAKIGFEGTLFLVDPFEDILLESEKLYRSLIPNAKIHLIASRLAESLEVIPKNPMCILSNHPIDDMIMASNQPKNILRTLFDWTSIEHEQTIPISLKVWSAIESNSAALDIVKKNIFDEWCGAFEKLKPDFSIISQYPSITLKNQGMNSLNIHAKEILDQLKHHYEDILELNENIQNILNANKHYNDAHIGMEVLNAKNWLIMRDNLL